MARNPTTFLSYLLTEMDDSYAEPMSRNAPRDSVGEDNPTDTITLDVPLLIRLLEYAKEDAEDDMALHRVAEQLTSLAGEGKTLTMDDYDSIVGGDRGGDEMDMDQEDPDMDQEMDSTPPEENEEIRKSPKLGKSVMIDRLKKDYADRMFWSMDEKKKTGADRSNHAGAAYKIRAHLKKQYGVDV